MNHEGEDAHLSSAAVVELDGSLSVDGLLVPSRGSQLSLLDVLLPSVEAELDQADEEEDLNGAEQRNGLKGSKAGLHACEWNTRSDVARETDTSGGDEVTEDSKHGDAAVFGLDGAQAVEALLVSVLEEAKRVPEAKRRLGSDGVLEVHLQGGGLAAHASGGEGGGADKRGEDGDELEHGLEAVFCEPRESGDGGSDAIFGSDRLNCNTHTVKGILVK